ncbi:hypothetical protein [Ornithinibacillus sp. 179-J 7C1 HS]
MDIDTANFLKKLTANMAFMILYLHLYIKDRTPMIAVSIIKTLK